MGQNLFRTEKEQEGNISWRLDIGLMGFYFLMWKREPEVGRGRN